MDAMIYLQLSPDACETASDSKAMASLLSSHFATHAISINIHSHLRAEEG